MQLHDLVIFQHMFSLHVCTCHLPKFFYMCIYGVASNFPAELHFFKQLVFLTSLHVLICNPSDAAISNSCRVFLTWSPLLHFAIEAACAVSCTHNLLKALQCVSSWRRSCQAIMHHNYSFETQTWIYLENTTGSPGFVSSLFCDRRHYSDVDSTHILWVDQCLRPGSV